jgi:aryl-alcohol dehydrogenase-like predicted oxidoreductase
MPGFPAAADRACLDQGPVPAVYCVLGARRVGQLPENLGSLEMQLAADALKCLESAADFDIGFPSSFISEASNWVFGAARAS